ncbi:MAG: cytochrome c [Alphaproteobacteria bacterium]|nr:cytochrome c [Alphaproteobacteria bacterium]
MNGKKKILTLLVFAAAAGLFWLFGPGEQLGEAPAINGVDADNAGLVARGQKVYAEACASCHGADLKGQKDWRTRNADGTLKAPPHDETGHTWHHPDRPMFDYIRKGGQAVVPPGFKSAMPPFGRDFGGAYPDADIWAVLSYIHSRWPEKVRDRQRQINARAPGAQK